MCKFKPFTIILCVLMLTFSTTLLGAENPNKDFSVQLTLEQKQEDLNFLCNELTNKHKNLFFKISRAEFEKEKQLLMKELPNLNNNEFLFGLKQLLAKVGDAHTDVYFKGDLARYAKIYPFAVTKFDNAWYISAIDKPHSAYLGAKLVEVNHYPIDKVYEKVATVIPHSNEAWLENNFTQKLFIGDCLKYLGLTETTDQILLTLEKPEEMLEETLKQDDNKLVTITLKGLHTKGFYKTNIVYLNQGDKVPVTAQKTDSIYHYLALDSDTLFIQYNSCEEDPKLPMSTFTKQIEEELRQKKYKKIIVDLRYNTGGNSEIIKPVFNVLNTYMKGNDCKLYALIGGNTFSSGLLNACYLKFMGATLVGRPTGGDVNHYGELKMFDLPNSDLLVCYSTKYFEVMKEYKKNSLEPDVLVEMNLADYIAGIDVDIKAIQEMK